jgi:hypothetical protein
VEPEKEMSTVPPLWRAVIAFASAGVIALGVLIVRELAFKTPPHRALAKAAQMADMAETPALAAPVAPVQTTRPAAPAPVASAAPADSTAASAAIPFAANVIARLAANPEDFEPSRVFAPPVAKEQLYVYDRLPPFNGTTLKRSRANPNAWEFDAIHGPAKMKDLGPAGSVREAAVVHDSAGSETSWYLIDAGPLAPAYAVEQGRTIRVMSKAFLDENRNGLPPEVVAALSR